MAAIGGYSIGQAVIADYARGARAARLMSRLALLSYMAPILAPLIGALLLRVTSWRGIFSVLGAMGLLFLVAAWRLVEESLPKERRVASGVVRAIRVMGGLVRDGRYRGLVLAFCLAGAAFYAYLTAVSFVFQELGGLTPTAFSLLFTINAAGMLGGTLLNHYLLSRFSPQSLLRAALILCVAAGIAVLAASLARPLNVVALAVSLFVFMSTYASVYPNALALALSLHRETAGTAAALFTAASMLLGSLVTPLVAIGGTSALLMALVILGSVTAGLIAFLIGPARADLSTP